MARPHRRYEARSAWMAYRMRWPQKKKARTDRAYFGLRDTERYGALASAVMRRAGVAFFFGFKLLASASSLRGACVAPAAVAVFVGATGPAFGSVGIFCIMTFAGIGLGWFIAMLAGCDA